MKFKSGEEGADWKDEKTAMRKRWAFERANRRDGAKRKMRAAECYCAFLSGRAILLPQDLQ